MEINKRLSHLLKLLEEDPDESFLLFAIAKEYESAGEWVEAYKQYELLKEKDPQYLGLYYQLGKVYEGLEMYDLAKRSYTSGIDLANEQGDLKTLSELKAALQNMLLEL